MPAAVQLRPGDRVNVDVSNIGALGLIASRRAVVAAHVVWAKRDNKMVRPMMTFGVELSTDPDAQLNVA
jgi:protein involved in polysaccharide export with SLBB domain